MSSQTWSQRCQWGLLRFWKNVLCHLFKSPEDPKRQGLQQRKSWQQYQMLQCGWAESRVPTRMSYQTVKSWVLLRMNKDQLVTQTAYGGCLLVPNSFRVSHWSNYLNTSYFIWALGQSPKEVWNVHFPNGKMGPECSKPRMYVSCKLGTRTQAHQLPVQGMI